MGPAASWLVPALIQGGAAVAGGLLSRGAAGSAADRQAQGATSAARIRAGSIQDQIDMANQAARQLRADTEVARSGNWRGWEADLINTSNLTWDQAENARRAGNILGQNLHNQYWDTEENRRQELLARGRTGYGQDVARNMRLGRIGLRMGMQAPGGRRMGQLFEPGPLVQSPYEQVGPLQRTDLVIPEYVPLGDALPLPEPPPPAPLTAAQIAERDRNRATRDPYDFEEDR